MFISRLKDKLIAYDKYGENRTHGLKILFVIVIMLIFELVSNLKNPYFYFFFVPLTSFTAEVIATNIKDKFLFTFVSNTGAAISVFLFGICSIYKTFFVFFVFFYSAALYYLAIYRLGRMLPLVPLMLGLASYSLIYVNQDVNFYIALNHFLIQMYALAIVCFSLLIFPRSYYFKIWKRAFYDVISQMAIFSEKLYTEEVRAIPVYPGMVMMDRYSKMLPSRMPKLYSILKITLLTFELLLSMSFLISFRKEIHEAYLKLLHKYLLMLSDACQRHEPLPLELHDERVLEVTHELRVLHRLILSWNYLCKAK